MPLTTNCQYAIAESDIIFKQMLIDNICRNPLYKMQYAASNGYELINSFKRKPADLLLIDLFMPVLSGIEAIKFIRMINKTVPIICYSGTYQHDIAILLAQLNITVYCEKKSTVVQHMLDAYCRYGQVDYTEYTTIWKTESEEKFKTFVAKESNPELTHIELRLMLLTYEGFTNREIALRLNLSTRTIDTYIYRLTEKLGLRNKIELIRYAVENGLYNTSE